MYRSTAEEYTCLQFASHTATQSFFPRWLKPSRKILLHFKTPSTMIQLFTLGFNPFLVCSKFFSILSPQLLKAPTAHSQARRRILLTHTKRVWIPTYSPSQDNIQIAVTMLASTSATKPALLDWPSSNHSPTPKPHSYRPQPSSPLPPATAMSWPPRWQAGTGELRKVQALG